MDNCNESNIPNIIQKTFFERNLAIFNSFLKTYRIAYQPLQTTHACIFLCLDGEVEISLNLKHYTIKKNNLLFLFPGVIWKYHKKSPDLSFIILIAKTEFLQQLQVNLQKALSMSVYIIQYPITQLTPTETEGLVDSISFLKRKTETETVNTDVIKFTFQAISAEIDMIFKQRYKVRPIKISRKEEIMKNFMQLLLKHYKQHRDVQFYANELCITPKHLSLVIKQTTKKGANEIINEYVTLQAKSMIKSSTLTIQQISNELNFANQSFFGKFFKRQTGMSPKQYRQL